MKPAPPYHFPSDDVIRAGPWLVETGPETRPLPAILSSWDYATDLALIREVEVDNDQALEQSRLDPDLARLGVGVMWRSTASELRGPALLAPVDGRDPLRLRVTLPGQDLGGTLELETVLVLMQEARERPRSARRAGSVLWSDKKRCRLQGDAPMFPIEITDFTVLPVDKRAPWHLDIRDDLDAPAMGALHLLANRDNDLVVDALAHADAPDDHQAAVLSAIYADVGRTLVEFALAHDRVGSGPFESETLGEMLESVIASAFPKSNAHALRRANAADPASWASELNAIFGLFAGR